MTVIDFHTRKPLMGTTLLSELFDVELFSPEIRGYLTFLVMSPEPVHSAVLYGWALRWHRRFGFSLDPVTAWWWRLSNHRKEMFEADALHELDTWVDAVHAAEDLIASNYPSDVGRLLDGIRMRRDDLESLALVYPGIREHLAVHDTAARELPYGAGNKYMASLLLTGEDKTNWWGVNGPD